MTAKAGMSSTSLYEDVRVGCSISSHKKHTHTQKDESNPNHTTIIHLYFFLCVRLYIMSTSANTNECPFNEENFIPEIHDLVNSDSVSEAGDPNNTEGKSNSLDSLDIEGGKLLKQLKKKSPIQKKTKIQALQNFAKISSYSSFLPSSSICAEVNNIAKVIKGKKDYNWNAENSAQLIIDLWKILCVNRVEQASIPPAAQEILNIIQKTKSSIQGQNDSSKAIKSFPQQKTKFDPNKVLDNKPCFSCGNNTMVYLEGHTPDECEIFNEVAREEFTNRKNKYDKLSEAEKLNKRKPRMGHTRSPILVCMSWAISCLNDPVRGNCCICKNNHVPKSYEER